MAEPEEEIRTEEQTDVTGSENGSWYESADPGPAAEPEAIYSDAHYEPAGEAAAPPRYYTPPVRAEKPRRERTLRRRKRRGLSLAAVICLCLACAILGGFLGAGLNYRMAESRFTAMEQAMEDNARTISENSQAIAGLDQRQGGYAVSIANAPGTLSPAQIYEMACSQVVGITTSVTTQSYFGSYQGEVSGSGFILSEDGYIVTNYHVVETADTSNLPITVVLHDGTKYEARIVGREDVNDLAVLKIEASGLKPVTLGDSSAISVGDEIFVVGNPLGELEFSMSTGHVSALDRVISTEEADGISMFQLDAAVNRGNSGGPVYNTRGEVVGVVTAKYSQSDVEGLGFAIPSNDAVRIAEDLVTKGYVSGKAYLGIMLDERYDTTISWYYNLPGACVSEVVPDSAADRAGLQRGDIITALNGEKVENSSDLRKLIRACKAGDSAELVFYRAGTSMTVQIVFDERTPEAESAAAAQQP